MFFQCLSFFLTVWGIADSYINAPNIQIFGIVAGGNYTYYSLLQKGHITLYLYSSKGDADLYISQFVVLPTFDPNQYCLHSASCGIDVVDVPAEFKRPVSIGIYGHPFHTESEFVLELKHRGFAEPDLWENTYVVENNIESEEGEVEVEVETDDIRRRGGVIISFLLTLLDIILEVFFL